MERSLDVRPFPKPLGLLLMLSASVLAASSPAPSAGRAEVYAEGLGGAAYRKACQFGAGWAPAGGDWERLGGRFAGPTAAVVWPADRIHFFAQGVDGAYYHRYRTDRDGSVWLP